MTGVASRILVLVTLSISALPAFAEDHGMPEFEMNSPGLCLWVNDAAFEHSLQDGLSEADQTALTNVYLSATFECLGLSMTICEGQDDSIECLSELSRWVQEERANIVARLPATIEYDNAITAERYVRTLERASAPADEVECDHLSDVERDRYCEIVAEGGALHDAYDAWRMARQEGVVDLVGHDPVDLELIR
jgi:hypothetical protein